MIRKQWQVAKCDKDAAAQIAQELGVDPFAALLVTAHGAMPREELDVFFDPDPPLTFDPFSIKDMAAAAARINDAIDRFESICVFGDYDADGVTATVLLYSYLEARGANVIRYIPDRLTEGYGLSVPAVEQLCELGVKLIVTVDNGVSAIEEAKRCRQLGIDLVVTDHHTAGAQLPDAVAVVDPHRPDCPSPFKEMAGVGVAFQLVCALEGGEADMLLSEYGDLVALGTIGDVVSLTGENRVMVQRGLALMNAEPRPGLTALADAAGMGDRAFTASSAAFTLCPRINAAGRMGSAEKALELLLCEDEETAAQIAAEIQAMNTERQRTETEIFRQVLARLAEEPALLKDPVLVVDGEGWHQGVIGIVAARMVERFGRPCIVIARDGETARGSCRSIEGFSVYDAIASAADCLTHFGGHPLAAGLGLETARIAEFRARVNAFAAAQELPFPVQRIDCRLHPQAISLELLDALSVLEPFGAGNPQPCFGLFGVRLEEISPVSEGRHMRMVVSKNGTRTGVVYFGMPEKQFPYERGDLVDLAVNLDRNVYNGETRVSVIVRAMRPGATQEQKVLDGMRLVTQLLRGQSLTAEQAARLLPERALQIEVFKSIRQHPLRDRAYEQLCVRLGDDGERYPAIAATVEIMLEMGILSVDAQNCVSVTENAPKVDLERSTLMRQIRSAMQRREVL